MHTAHQRLALAQLLVHLQHILRALRLILQAHISTHQMPGIQHNAHILVLQTLKEILHIAHIRKPQPRPPQILKQHRHMRRNLVTHSIKNIGRRCQNLAVAIIKLKRKGLLIISLRHMPHQILRALGQRSANITANNAQPLITAHRILKILIALTDIAKLLLQALGLLQPKIHPIGPIIQMHAHRNILIFIRNRVHRINKLLNAIDAHLLDHLMQIQIIFLQLIFIPINSTIIK